MRRVLSLVVGAPARVNWAKPMKSWPLLKLPSSEKIHREPTSATSRSWRSSKEGEVGRKVSGLCRTHGITEATDYPVEGEIRRDGAE
jgi:hypothetical protein